MPLYEYKCHSCGKKFEVLQKFSDEPIHTHAECGGEVEKLISAPAFHFKGTGWYVTDYAKGNGNGAPPPKPSEGSDGKPGEGKLDSGDSKSETKSESKSEAKSETSAPAPATSSSSESK